jgi:hypothetical protein
MANLINSSTRNLDWYNVNLKKNDMEPLTKTETIVVLESIKMQETDQTTFKVNRTYDDFAKSNLSTRFGIKTLVLGSGPKHANQPDEKPFTYTVDIDEGSTPDLVASINNEEAMKQIPDESFDQIIWESVPGGPLLNTEHFYQVHRILKTSGVAHLKIPIVVSRTLPVLIQETPFKDQIPVDYGRGVLVDQDEIKLIFNEKAFDFINKDTVNLRKN